MCDGKTKGRGSRKVAKGAVLLRALDSGPND